MSGGNVCRCSESKKPIKERNWKIMAFRCNHSAFNGWRETASDYSEIQCNTCNYRWRTKANYVYELK